MPFALLAAAALSIGAPTYGSVYGKVTVKPAYFLGKGGGFGRRLGLPPPAQREPAGVIVTLEGPLLDKEKFDPATDEYAVKIENGGFATTLVGGMVGTKLTFENGLDRALTFAGAPFLKDALEPKGKKSVTLDTPGVYTVTEPSLPGSKLTVVVTSNPYVIALDETGEFLFESLEVGAYTLRIFTKDRAVTSPLEIKADERTDLILPLGKNDSKPTGAQPKP